MSEQKHTPGLPEATLLRTRWLFSSRVDGYAIDAWVEFSVDSNGRKRADVYDYAGRRLLWSTWGIRRRDGVSARMAFVAYVGTLKPDCCDRCLQEGQFPPNSDLCLSCGGTGIVETIAKAKEVRS